MIIIMPQLGHHAPIGAIDDHDDQWPSQQTVSWSVYFVSTSQQITVQETTFNCQNEDETRETNTNI